jgi:hypothetical protein
MGEKNVGLLGATSLVEQYLLPLLRQNGSLVHQELREYERSLLRSGLNRNPFSK